MTEAREVPEAIGEVPEGIAGPGEVAEAEKPPEIERPPEVPAKPAQPTPMTFVVQSTTLYNNDMLFYRTMDRLCVQFDVRHVVAEYGSSVAKLAQFWCKRNKVAFTLVLPDYEIAEREDRKRRYAQMVALGPAALLLFNQCANWHQMALAFHEKGIPVSFVVARTHENKPDYVPWKPGMQPPATISVWEIHKLQRKARPRERVTKEHAAEVKRAATARHDEKRRLIKIMRRIKDGTFAQHAWRFGPRKKRRAITPAGHRPTMM